MNTTVGSEKECTRMGREGDAPKNRTQHPRDHGPRPNTSEWRKHRHFLLQPVLSRSAPSPRALWSQRGHRQYVKTTLHRAQDNFLAHWPLKSRSDAGELRCCAVLAAEAALEQKGQPRFALGKDQGATEEGGAGSAQRKGVRKITLAPSSRRLSTESNDQSNCLNFPTA